MIALLKNIRIKKSSIDELNEGILNTVEEDKMEDEMTLSTDLDIMIDTEMEILEGYLSACDSGIQQKKRDLDLATASGSNYSPSRYSHSSSYTETIERRQNRAKVRLPTFELKKFVGDPTLWPEFFDSFNVAVDENPDLTDIERFTYLKGYLSQEAAKCKRNKYDAAARTERLCHHMIRFFPPVEKLLEENLLLVENN